MCHRHRNLAFVLLAPCFVVGSSLPLTAQVDWYEPAVLSPPALRHSAMALDEARNRIVLFGGFDGIPTSETWEWDGIRWFHRHPAHSPPPRFEHAMAYDPIRQRMVVYGGLVTFTQSIGDTWTWDGVDWSLASTTGPGNRGEHAMAFVPNLGMLVTAGGYNAPTDTWGWDGAQWSRLQTVGDPPRRIQHCMSTEPFSGGLLLAGGQWGGELLWRFDGASWVSLPPAVGPPYRWHATMCVDPTGSFVLLSGGLDSGRVFRDTWSFDGVQWTQLPPPPEAQWGHAAAPDPRGNDVLVFGGSAERSVFRGECRLFNGRSWQESTASPPPTDYPVMACDDARNEVVLLMIGSLGSETWIRSGGSWRRARPRSNPIVNSGTRSGMTYDPLRERVVAITQPPNGGSTTWEWDGSEWSLRTTPVAPPYPQPIAFDRLSGRTIWFGSWPGTAVTGTWAWNGSYWTQLATAHSPSPRFDHAMVWDDHLQRIVLFGGRASDWTPNRYGDTWVWDGSDWRALSVNSVLPRFNHVMAFDPVRQRTVLFGGGDGSQNVYLGDTWDFDGLVWRRRSGVRDIGARVSAAAAWDPFEKLMVLFAGVGPGVPNLSAEHFSDTWLFGTTKAPSVIYSGSRCFSGSRTPHLRLVSASGPWVGETVTLRLDDLAPEGGHPTFGFVGSSDREFLGVRLPFWLGTPGCSILVGPDIIQPITQTGFEAFWSIPVPDDHALTGIQVHTQAITLEAGANASGVVPTNAASLTIGVR